MLTVSLVGCQSTGGVLGHLPRTSHAPRTLAQRVGKYRHSRSERALQQNAEAQMNLARSLEQQGKTADAVYAYSTALAFGERADARHRLAVLYDKQGDFEKSDTHYREALRQAPRDAELLCDRGYSFLLQSRPAEAEEYLRKAIKQQPDLSRAHNNLGLVLAQQGRADVALVEFAAAGCSHAEARTNLAFALMLSGDLDEAQYQLTLAQQADSLLQPAEELRAAMIQLMSLAGRSPASEAPPAPYETLRPSRGDTNQQAAIHRTISASAPAQSARQAIMSFAERRGEQTVRVTHRNNQNDLSQADQPLDWSPAAQSHSQPLQALAISDTAYAGHPSSHPSSSRSNSALITTPVASTTPNVENAASGGSCAVDADMNAIDPSADQAIKTALQSTPHTLRIVK
jgi:Flp pilus assembly protein TadD